MGALDAAASALETVLAMPANRRIDPIPQRLAGFRAGLSAPAYQGSALARDLGERIGAFTRDAIATGAI